MNMQQRLALIDSGLIHLPKRFSSDESRVLLLATGYQESKFLYRRQKTKSGYGFGPAVSFFQFERIGIKEVLINSKTKIQAALMCEYYGINNTVAEVRQLFTESRGDSLSVIFSRLNYFKESGALPSVGEEEKAYAYYTKTWRPGKERPEDWPDSYRLAIETLETGKQNVD